MTIYSIYCEIAPDSSLTAVNYQKEGIMSPLCGFKPRMIAGIREFGEGIFEQAKEKAKKDGLSLHQSVDVEIEETGLFLEMLTAQDPEKHEALISVAHLARALYRNAQGSDQPEKAFLDGIEHLTDFLKELDDTYYREFRPGNSAEVAIKQLGEWVQARPTS